MKPQLTTVPESASLESSTCVTLGGECVEVKPLSPKMFFAIVSRLEVLPAVALQFAYGSNQNANIAQTVTAAMLVAYDEVFDILALATDKSREFLEEETGIHEIVDYIEKVIEVNRFPQIAAKFGAVLNRFLAKSA